MGTGDLRGRDRAARQCRPTASIVLGSEAPAWLTARGIPARLDSPWATPPRRPDGPHHDRRNALVPPRAGSGHPRPGLTIVSILGDHRRPAPTEGRTGDDRHHGHVHRWLSLGLLALPVAHIVTATADGREPRLVERGPSRHERLRATGVGLGTAVDLMVAVLVTSLLRHRINPRTWRTALDVPPHAWPSAVVHALVLSHEQSASCNGISPCAVALGAVAWRPWRATTTAIAGPRSPPRSGHDDPHRHALIDLLDASGLTGRRCRLQRSPLRAATARSRSIVNACDGDAWRNKGCGWSPIISPRWSRGPVWSPPSAAGSGMPRTGAVDHALRRAWAGTSRGSGALAVLRGEYSISPPRAVCAADDQTGTRDWRS